MTTELTERVRKLERELSDWDRLLAYAESD